MGKVIVKKYLETEFDKISIDKRGDIIRLILSYKGQNIVITDWVGLTDGDSVCVYELEEGSILRLPLAD